MNTHTFPAVKNWQFSPPAGGWSVTVELQGSSRLIGGFSPHEVRNRAESFARSVGSDISLDEIEIMLNDEWNRRDPSRAIPTLKPNPQAPAPAERVRRDATVTYWSPKLWGPQAWGWLHSFGMPGAFDKTAWKVTCDRIERLLNPSLSVRTGCAECFNEWLDICQKDPPAEVTDPDAAARWTWEAHNRVNRKLGKAKLSWEEAANLHGWTL